MHLKNSLNFQNERVSRSKSHCAGSEMTLNLEKWSNFRTKTTEPLSAGYEIYGEI